MYHQLMLILMHILSIQLNCIQHNQVHKLYMSTHSNNIQLYKIDMNLLMYKFDSLLDMLHKMNS